MLAELASRRSRAATGASEAPEDCPPVKVDWRPNPGPQSIAYLCEADELGYGGQAGGGKTDLLLGLGLTSHHRSHIFRREATQLHDIWQRLREILGAQGQANETLKRWRLGGGRMIQLASCEHEKDWEKWQGRAADLKGFDELTAFSESMYLKLGAWNRSVIEGQRCRRVATFNPPTTAEGEWVTERFSPWLDPGSANPARPGDLLWFVRIDGVDTLVDGPGEFRVGDQTYRPQSRTFIPAALSDNPFLTGTDYESVLDQLPEPLRSQLKHGEFGLSRMEDPWQVIPAAWVEAAQKRWTEDPPKARPDAIGVDPARGGADRLARCARHGVWYSRVDWWQGEPCDTGPKAAALASSGVPSGCPFFVDVIGIGSSVHDSLVSMGRRSEPVNVSESSSRRDRSGALTFRNLRTELWWRLREALDPDEGAGLALPPGKDLRRELCAPRYTVMMGGVIAVEPKSDISTRIGSSPDLAEAVILASMSGAEVRKRIRKSGTWS